MSKAIWEVFTSCPAEKEAEFNQWYDTIHVPDLLAIEGITAARRYKLSGPGPKMQTNDGEAVAQYLAIYELDTDDTRSLMRRVGQALGELTQRGRMFDGVQLIGAATYTALGERQVSG